jgi:hypothetical protein
MTVKVFSKDELRELAGNTADLAISIYMPTEKAGATTQQNGIRFKNLLRQVEKEFDSISAVRADAVAALLSPARELLEDEFFWQQQKDGLAVFRAGNLFRYYRVPERFEELSMVGEQFYLKPMLRLLTGDGRFYVLCLDRAGVRLFESTRHEIHELGLGDTPTTFVEVVGDQIEEQHLQWHTGTPGGAAGGGRPAVFHGQGGGDDDQEPEIRKFLAAVDEGVRGILRGQDAPLVAIGLDDLLSTYLKLGSYPALVKDGLRLHPGDLTPDALRDRAWSVVEPIFLANQKNATARFLDLSSRRRTSTSLQQIVPAAAEGRVEILFVARGARRWGRFDETKRRVKLGKGPGPGARELLDLASVQTLLHGGTVFSVAPDDVPGMTKGIAALYRF